MQPGDCFVALRGKRYDGHDFVSEVARKGAKAVFIEKEMPLPSPQVTAVVVPDTLAALGAIAAFNRKRFSIPVVAVTGSNGKTTTKEMIAHLLSAKGPVLKNEGTKNNRIGVPLTLLSLEERHRFAVVELGMSEPGEIGILSRMVSPSVGVITNIGPAHLTLLGSLDAVFQCKMELLEGLQDGGTLVVNKADPYLSRVREPRRKVLFFGKGTLFDATDVHQKGDELFFRFNGHLEGSLSLLGEQNVENGLAATAVASLFGIDPSESLTRLRVFQGVGGRMKPRQIGEIAFIDDTYNANPESTRRALESFERIQADGKKIFVFGNMLELGETSRLYHEKIGERVAASPISLFITVGTEARYAHEAAKRLGMNGERIAHFETSGEAGRFLVGKAQKGDRILVKGSRGMKMEEVFNCFTTCSIR